MKKTAIKLSLVVLALALTTPIKAQITAFYGMGSAWQGTPTFKTQSAPTFASAEGNFGGGTANGLAETFSLSTGGTLSSIQIGLAGNGSFGLALYDLGTTIPAQSGGNTFTVSTANLLADGFATSSFTTTAFTGSQVAVFNFAGSDAVTLAANEAYAFVVMTATANTSASTVQWTRGGSAAVPPNGQLYRANSGSTGFGAINGGVRAGDFAITVAAAPEPSSLALLGGGLVLIGAIRRFKK